jgi:radical SAM protein with 4Fe4S-binding SPASM domain
MQVYSLEGAEKFLPANEKYRRYRIEGPELRTKSAQKNRCVELWERSIITWDGAVAPCCFDKDVKHPVGDLKESSFFDTWKSPAFQAFRRRILTARNNVDICANCTSGLRIYR